VNLPSPGDGFDVQAQYCRGWSGRCIINSSARLADQTFGLVNSGTIGLASMPSWRTAPRPARHSYSCRRPGIYTRASSIIGLRAQ
jgi:hypothetical protein